MEKIEKTLQACDRVVNGIEDETLSTTSALLQCSKIVRLLNDEEAMIWLQYEYGGYPRNDEGKVPKDAWNLAYKSGRGYMDEGKRYIFTELASELEEKLTAQQNAIGNFTTNGASVSGDLALLAMSNLTASVQNSTASLVREVSTSQKRLASLRAKYYEYALKKQIELSFSNVVTDVFQQYREKVDNAFSSLSKETILKLKAIEGKLESKNPELYSQVLTTCRRLFESTDVHGNNYKNKLSAVIEMLEDKSTSKTLIGSNICYLLDWIDNLVNLQCKGVHSEITKETAEKCILQTYMCLGDILNMQINNGGRGV